MHNTIREKFDCIGLQRECKAYWSRYCQQYKNPKAGYRYLPPKHVNMTPWDEICVNIIGPWNINIGGYVHSFNALTCIDPVSNHVEIIRIDNRYSYHARDQFQNCWLSHYLKPNRCVHDKRRDFIGWELIELLNTYGIKDVINIVENPQSNATCNHMHQMVANILQVSLHMIPQLIF